MERGREMGSGDLKALLLTIYFSRSSKKAVPKDLSGTIRLLDCFQLPKEQGRILATRSQSAFPAFPHWLDGSTRIANELWNYCDQLKTRAKR